MNTAMHCTLDERPNNSSRIRHMPQVITNLDNLRVVQVDSNDTDVYIITDIRTNDYVKCVSLEIEYNEPPTYTVCVTDEPSRALKFDRKVAMFLANTLTSQLDLGLYDYVKLTA